MTDAQTEARAIAQKWHSESADVNTLADYIATALAAKDAELAEKNRLLEIALRKTAPARNAAIKRAERAEAQLVETRKALADIERFHRNSEYVLGAARRALEAQGGENGR